MIILFKYEYSTICGKCVRAPSMLVECVRLIGNTEDFMQAVHHISVHDRCLAWAERLLIQKTVHIFCAIILHVVFKPKLYRIPFATSYTRLNS